MSPALSNQDLRALTALQQLQELVRQTTHSQYLAPRESTDICEDEGDDNDTDQPRSFAEAQLQA